MKGRRPKGISPNGSRPLYARTLRVKVNQYISITQLAKLRLRGARKTYQGNAIPYPHIISHIHLSRICPIICPTYIYTNSLSNEERTRKRITKRGMGQMGQIGQMFGRTNFFQNEKKHFSKSPI